MPGVGHVGDRHLVGAPVAFDLQPVDLLGAGPALGAAQDDHRPAGALFEPAAPGLGLNSLDFVDHRVEGRRHELVHPRGVVPSTK